MATNIRQFISPKHAEASQTSQYTVGDSSKIIIDKFTATNTGSDTATISVNLVPTNGSVGDSNLITKTRAIPAGETYTLPELSGQVVLSSGFISTIASIADTIVIAASGREIT